MEVNLTHYNRLCRIAWSDSSISPEEVENLIRNGAIAPNDMILWSVMNGREDLVDTLLEKGANPNKRGYNDNIPALFRAAEAYKRGSTFSPIRLLLKAGANPHHFVEWYDGENGYHGTIAVVAYKAFGINILKAA